MEFRRIENEMTAAQVDELLHENFKKVGDACDENAREVATKADSAALEKAVRDIATKADKTVVEEHTRELAAKANAATVEALNTDVQRVEKSIAAAASTATAAAEKVAAQTIELAQNKKDISALQQRAAAVEQSIEENNKKDTQRDEAINVIQQGMLGYQKKNAQVDASIEDIRSKIGQRDARIKELEGYRDKMEELGLTAWYGVEIDTTVANPDLKRIGNLDLHRSLPVQSKMRRCILKDNGEVAYYLDANNSNLKENGEAAHLDGTDGMVMVEIPTFYMRFEEKGTKQRVMMSTLSLPGFFEIKKFYVSAFEATIQRSTNKLSSVVSLDKDYRGGNNDSSLDADPNKSQLGKAATNVSLEDFRTYAKNRGTHWHCYTYDAHKWLTWLFVVEYATRNSQKAYNSELSVEGFHQGGLGEGATNISWVDIAAYNQLYLLPCGITATLGDMTGEKNLSAYSKSMQINSFRGVESIFGGALKLTEQSIIINKKDMIYEGVSLKKPYGGFVSNIVFGEKGDIIPTDYNAGSNSYYCDAAITNNTEGRYNIIFGGKLYDGKNAGLFSFSTAQKGWAVTYSSTRLCYIPE